MTDTSPSGNPVLDRLFSGMEDGERRARESSGLEGPSIVDLARKTVDALVESSWDEDAFSKTLAIKVRVWEEATKGLIRPSNGLLACQALPVGAFFHNDMLMTIQFSRAVAAVSSQDVSSMICASAAGMMSFLACGGIPIGLWAHEMQVPLGGVCGTRPPGYDPMLGGIRTPGDCPEMRDGFMEAINGAMAAAATRDKGLVVGTGSPYHDIADILYCCVTGKDQKTAISLSNRDIVACAVGGIMSTSPAT